MTGATRRQTWRSGAGGRAIRAAVLILMGLPAFPTSGQVVSVAETAPPAAELPAAQAPAWQKLRGISFGGSFPGLDQPKPTPREKACQLLTRGMELGKQSGELAEKGNSRAIDGFFAATELAWNAVWTCPDDPEILRESAEVYAMALEGLLESASRHGRLDGRGLRIGPDWGPICVPIETPGMGIDAVRIEHVAAMQPPDDPRISRHHARGGFGLPVSVRIATPWKRDGTRALAPARQSVAATAVLRFSKPAEENFFESFSGPLARDHSPAILDLVNPMEIAAVSIGPACPLLAADLTAPLLDMLEGVQRTDRITGFLQPYGGSDTQPRLELIQPHTPGRIPVVFIHGLGSDEGTWFDLINELNTRPMFRRRFEPWVYHYPTGSSFLQSAAQLRLQLQQAVRHFDPEKKDPALENMVLIGHSMGGLHAKLMVVDPGTAMWDSIADRPFSQVRMRPQIRRDVAPAYFFKPLPFVKRVVFIATPHSGSSLASLLVGRFASATIRQPAEMELIHSEVVQANPGAFHADYEAKLPTTIDVLEPTSSILLALHALRIPCWVTTHSIIGNASTSLISGPGDNVVPVTSARLPCVVSEVIVPAVHTKVHHHPISVLEIERILEAHLLETGASPSP